MELYPRKCSSTGKGISKGFIVGDEIYSTQYKADLECKKAGYRDYDEAYQEDFAYYTEFDDENEVQTQGYGYLANGTKIFVITEEALDNHIKEIDEEIETCIETIKEMFPDYEGEYEDILDDSAEDFTGTDDLDYGESETFGYEQGSYRKLI